MNLLLGLAIQLKGLEDNATALTAGIITFKIRPKIRPWFRDYGKIRDYAGETWYCYEAVVNWLKKVKIAYFQLGRKAERSAYHSQLEAAHRQKLNLIKLFKQLNKQL